MALGKIKADTLEHSTAGSVDTQYVVNGSVKAYANQDNGTSLNKSLNISSLTDNSTGRYELAITNAFTDANFGQMVCAGPAKEANCNIDTGHNTAAIMASRMYRTDSSAYVDSGDCNYYGVGDLA